jgi:hypothetical protein
MQKKGEGQDTDQSETENTIGDIATSQLERVGGGDPGRRV